MFSRLYVLHAYTVFKINFYICISRASFMGINSSSCEDLADSCYTAPETVANKYTVQLYIVTQIC